MLDETGEQAAAVGVDPFAQGTWMALAYTVFIGGIVGLVLPDRPLHHGSRGTIRPAASGLRPDFERVVP
jgi:hypothetical protein